MSAPSQGNRWQLALHDLSRSLGELFGNSQARDRNAVTVEVLFGLMGLLARADSIVTSHETELVNSLMDDLQLSMRDRQRAFEAFERGRKNECTLAAEMQRFLAQHPKGTPEAARLFDCLVRLAAADERVRPRERAFLEEMAVYLGYDPKTLEERLQHLSGKTG